MIKNKTPRKSVLVSVNLIYFFNVVLIYKYQLAGHEWALKHTHTHTHTHTHKPPSPPNRQTERER